MLVDAAVAAQRPSTGKIHRSDESDNHDGEGVLGVVEFHIVVRVCLMLWFVPLRFSFCEF